MGEDFIGMWGRRSRGLGCHPVMLGSIPPHLCPYNSLLSSSPLLLCPARRNRKKPLDGFDPEIPSRYLRWGKAVLLSQHKYSELYLSCGL